MIERRDAGETLVLVGEDAEALGVACRDARAAEPGRRVVAFLGRADAPELEEMVGELTGRDPVSE